MTRDGNRPTLANLFLCGLAFLGLLLGTISVALAQSNSEIRVSGPRPLAAAVLVLEARMKVPITYEDPPYQFRGDTAISPDGPLIPRPGNIQFSYSDQLEKDEILRSLIEANSKQGNPGIFEMKSAEGFYHVVPVKYTDERGEPKTHSSILEARISFSVQDVNGFSIIDLICKTLSKKLNEHIVVGMIPRNAFSAEHKKFTADDRSARDCLTEVIKKTGHNLSWQLFYDPKLRWYVLNIHPVGYDGQGSQ